MSKIGVYITIIFVLLMVFIPTYTKVVNVNTSRLNEVNKKKVIEAAKKCIYEGACDTNKVTIKTLKEKKYLTDDLIDPKTKEVISEDSYALIQKEESTFVIV